MWHILDARAIWVKEFAAALSKQVPTLAWVAEIRGFAPIKAGEHETVLSDPALRLRSFPLQRGFARSPMRWLLPTGHIVGERLRRQGNGPGSVLICTAPHYESVAHQWKGPVVYYVTDYFFAYGESSERILRLDRRMCERANLICPNSRRIAQYLETDAGCPPEKIAIVPNATRRANVLAAPALTPALAPDDIADLPRPIAGIIGNLAANIDWVLLRDAIERTPWLSWLLVGPTEMPVPDREHRHARAELMARGGSVRFIGFKNYGLLQAYARSFEVAVLPYRKREPTYSGSSTRFYEHLAAGRPMVATDGFAELLDKEPLLRIVRSSGEMVAYLDWLRQRNFRDGNEELRWRASHDGTWEARAATVHSAMSQRQANLKTEFRS